MKCATSANTVPSAHSGLGIKTTLIGIELEIDDEDKSFFRHLHTLSTEIEREIGTSLNWEEKPGSWKSVLSCYIGGQNFDDEAEWTIQHTWLKEKAEVVRDAILKRINDRNTQT